MRPVALTLVEDKTYILGTFDTTSFQVWWKSEPFPGEVKKIYQPIHVYGQYHCAIVEMLDGTWSIYRTGDYGKTWASVYTSAVRINALQLIDPGRVVAATLDGWIETQNSGLNWSVVSVQAPNCTAIVSIGDDILIAQNTDAVFRSTDVGRNWTQVLDCQSIYWRHFHSGYRTTSYSGTVYPTLAGSMATVACGIGPYFLYSNDQGVTWTMPWFWAGDPATLVPDLPPLDNKRIIQIALTDVSGALNENCTFITRCYRLTDGIVRYYIGNGITTCNPIMDRPYHGVNSGWISSYAVQEPGSTDIDYLVTLTDYNAGGQPVVKRSIDGGYVWLDVPTSGVTVYEGDPSQEIYSPSGAQTFSDEFYGSSSWVGSPCHNTGYWMISGTRRWSISHDMDFKTRGIMPATVGMDIVNMLRPTKTYTHDIFNKKTIMKSTPFDVVNKRVQVTSRLLDVLMQKSITTPYSMDVYSVQRYNKEYTQDVVSLRHTPLHIYHDVEILDTLNETYSMGMYVVESGFDDILTSIEYYLPQVWDISGFKNSCPVFDSRRITIE